MGFKKPSRNVRFPGPDPKPLLSAVPHTKGLLRPPAGLPINGLVSTKQFLLKHTLVFRN